MNIAGEQELSGDQKKTVRAYGEGVENALKGIYSFKEDLFNAAIDAEFEVSKDYANKLRKAVAMIDDTAMPNLIRTEKHVVSAAGATIGWVSVRYAVPSFLDAPIEADASTKWDVRVTRGISEAKRALGEIGLVIDRAKRDRSVAGSSNNLSRAAAAENIITLVECAREAVESAIKLATIPEGYGDGDGDGEGDPVTAPGRGGGHGGEESSESASSAESADGTRENATGQQPQQVPVAVQLTLQAMRDEDDEKNGRQKSNRQLADVSGITDGNCGDGLEGPQ